MGKFWKLDVKMNQCYPKCGLGIFGGGLYLLGTLTDRHTAWTERMRKKCLGMVHGEEGGYREGQGVKTTGREMGKEYISWLSRG